jgi:hypothetical protein
LQVDLPPKPPKNLRVNGTAAALVVGWDTGQSGCTYTVYYSKVNTPVNFDSGYDPTPITTGVDATSAVLAPITDYASGDLLSDFTDLQDAFTTNVYNINSAYPGGGIAFRPALVVAVDSIQTAIATYGAAIKKDVGLYQTMVNQRSQALIDWNDSLDPDLSVVDWKSAMKSRYGGFLQFLGMLLNRQPGLFALPDGSLG